MAKYNGHKNWNHWNVALWIGNDEGLYRLALDVSGDYTNAQDAARALVETLADAGLTHTPDGTRYSVSAVRAALVGLNS